MLKLTVLHGEVNSAQIGANTIFTVFCLVIQIEELTSNLPQLQSLSSSASSVDSMVSTETASPPSKRKVTTKIQGNAKKTLLKWVQHTAGK